MRKFRIHGDNIVECERTLNMLIETYECDYKLLDCPIYFPKYELYTKKGTYIVELLSGHGRWSNIDLGKFVHDSGGRLRESADSYITEIIDNQEKVILAIEYCSALPAGNNAWQRNGRALASVLSNVPYLYYAEIGGVELDENRIVKAPRYPNPAVPFSYVSLTYDAHRICLPVYRAHPSMTEQNRSIYESSLGYKDGLVLIRELIENENINDVVNALFKKAIIMVKTLANNRRTRDTLRKTEWKELLIAPSKTDWLLKFKEFGWTKKSADKVLVSNSFERLKLEINNLDPKSITAKGLPFCVISKDKVKLLKEWIKNNYDLEADINEDKDLAIVWITGFKPHGDDSRPDRGLSPLCRMILGNNANIMAIVSGPAKEYTWDLLKNDKERLIKDNGLFESIYACCDYMLVDSATCDYYYFDKTDSLLDLNKGQIFFKYIENPEVDFYEHDVDCAIHQILSHKEDIMINECFCNPPGGDWSGITFFQGQKEYKWTSLPRVSDSSKRPDHIFQIENNGHLYFVTIESKGKGKDLEKNIGNRLKDYIKDLFNSEPTSFRTNDNNEWSYYNDILDAVDYDMLSVGAFIYENDVELTNHLTRGNLDAVFAFQFGEMSILHFKGNQKGTLLLQYLNDIALKQGGFIVKVH